MALEKMAPEKHLLLINIKLLVVGKILLTKTIYGWTSEGVASHIVGLTVRHNSLGV